MMKCYLFFAFPLLIACSDTSLKGEKLERAIGLQKKNTMISDSTRFSDLMTLSAKEAIAKYGTPVKQERFVLDDLQGEFRNGISDKFTLEERLSESIVIEELTWEKDQETFVTVWYHELPQGLAPKETLAWDKESEF